MIDAVVIGNRTCRYVVACCLAWTMVLAHSSPGQTVRPEEFILENGLKVVMVEDHTVPSVCFSIAFRVGSRNETAGITGISHLFEHMMFNGSALYAPTQFDSILEAGGGYSNAYTSNDITFYYEEFNPDLLETVLRMEADRMKTLKLDSGNLEQERGIVKEERRVSTDNSIPGAMFEELYASAFVAHPYQNPVVGWMGDLDNIFLEDAREYFRVYYAPNNATVFVVGDFSPAFLTEKMVEYFGDIPSQETPRPVVNSEPRQNGEKRIVLRKEARLPSVAIGYKGPAVSSPDIFPLRLLSTILSDGQSSRLYQRLVYHLELVTEIETGMDEYVDPGLFTVYAQMQTGTATEEAEREIFQAIDSIAGHGVTERELQKAKNGMQVGSVNQFKTNVGIATTMGHYEVIWGDYSRAFEVNDRFAAVSVGDIQRVAKEYLVPERRIVVTLVPEQAVSGEKEPTE